MRDPRRLTRSFLAAVIGLAAACSTATPRAGLQSICTSDRDCTYGLVCSGEKQQKRCDYEHYDKCEKTEECLPGRTCRNGSCTVQCLTDNDCLSLSEVREAVHSDGGTPAEAAARCVIGECKSEQGDRKCALPGDCRTGEDCVAGRCVDRSQMRCMSDFDCNANERCVGHMCR